MRQVRESSTFAGDQREAYDELSVVDQHPADIGSETFDREMDRSLLDMVDREQELVRRALERKAQGKYGICSRCGRRIDPQRLAARPEAIYCVDCQRLVDAGRA
jgi:RNA polymerase-binding transcription factor DksA